MTDFRGTEITKGATVVYPNRQGSALWMNEGTVTAIVPFGIEVQRKDTARKVMISETQRVVVIA